MVKWFLTSLLPLRFSNKTAGNRWLQTEKMPPPSSVAEVQQSKTRVPGTLLLLPEEGLPPSSPVAIFPSVLSGWFQNSLLRMRTHLVSPGHRLSPPSNYHDSGVRWKGPDSIQSFATTLCLLTGCPFCKHAESGRYSSESSLCTQSFGQSQGVQKERKAVVEFLGQKWFERSSSHFSRSVWWWWQALCCGFC